MQALATGTRTHAPLVVQQAPEGAHGIGVHDVVLYHWPGHWVWDTPVMHWPEAGSQQTPTVTVPGQGGGLHVPLNKTPCRAAQSVAVDCVQVALTQHAPVWVHKLVVHVPPSKNVPVHWEAGTLGWHAPVERQQAPTPDCACVLAANVKRARITPIRTKG
jgi:hypothetical protein